MNYLNQSREELERELERQSRPIRLILEEFARRDSEQNLIDHHGRALEEFTYEMNISGMNLRALGEELYALISYLAPMALIYESRFRDAGYTNLVYQALQPLKEGR